jgi:hypothetical protein
MFSSSRRKVEAGSEFSVGDSRGRFAVGEDLIAWFEIRVFSSVSWETVRELRVVSSHPEKTSSVKTSCVFQCSGIVTAWLSETVITRCKLWRKMLVARVQQWRDLMWNIWSMWFNETVRVCVLGSFAGKLRVETEDPNACATVCCKLCKSGISSYLSAIKSVRVSQLLINPIIRTRTRLISGVHHPTRHNIHSKTLLIRTNWERTFVQISESLNHRRVTENMFRKSLKLTSRVLLGNWTLFWNSFNNIK